MSDPLPLPSEYQSCGCVRHAQPLPLESKIYTLRPAGVTVIKDLFPSSSIDKSV